MAVHSPVMAPPLHSAPIVSVLAFRRGARITRALRVDGGLERARIGPLPLALLDGSLRVRAEGATVRDAAVVVDAVEPSAHQSGRPARNEALEAARLLEGKLEARIAAVRASLDALGRLELPPRGRLRGQEPGPSPTSARLALARLRRELSDARHERLRELDEELRQAKEARAALEEEERRATTARRARQHELRKFVELTLDDVSAGAELQLEYDVAAARWYPVYTLRFDDDYAEARLEVRALVAQRTGEDWSGVRLTCSTALPRRRAELPEPKSIRLGRSQPEPAKGFREPPEGAGALFVDFDAGFPAPPPSTRTGATKGALRMPTGRATPPGMPVVPQSAKATSDSFGPLAGALAGAAPPAPLARPGGPPPAVRSAPAAPPPAPAAPRRARAKKRGAADRSGRYAAPAGRAVEEAAADLLEMGGGGPPPPEAPLALEVPDDLLDFGSLRMAGPDEPRRGQLRAATPDERFGSANAASVARAAQRSALPSAPARAIAPAPIAGFDHAYVADASIQVPSDGTFHSVLLRELRGAAARRYVVVPRESRDVFRHVALAEPLGEPLLPGPLDVYVGDRFVASRGMPTTPAGERLELGLGVEPAIEVARNATFEEKTTGLMRGGLDLVHLVNVELENHLRAAAEIEVRERLPVPAEGEEEVEVRIDSVTPRWETWEPEPALGEPPLRGGRRWRLRLAPAGSSGARQRLQARYMIAIAGKHALVGGNRRES